MLDINFIPFPELETERLVLKRITLMEASTMYTLRSNVTAMQYIPRPLMQTLDDAKKHIQAVDDKINLNECINWGIYLKESGQMIGTIGYPHFQLDHFRSEIGYMILPQYNGKGYMTEALTKAVDYGFSTIKLHSIEALVNPENVGSRRVLEKCGFVKEAHLKENFFFNGVFLDTVIYSKLNK
ncbi:GNAT family N-acetyltransferase [Myroides marinus]|uniref:GNAT family N-acetyltransferase n=1 Tax=Myroides marinus TaxID=703342 RepID=UPI00257739DB|nr:GNAT family N-acetyltransferase [Myroides marinus]MDM1531590.1 GNAT family N-acetyltransferase [Myroides marinus]MDM1538683.1 GNAT family N-acetyltransferase [Myroides marinus]